MKFGKSFATLMAAITVAFIFTALVALAFVIFEHPIGPPLLGLQLIICAIFSCVIAAAAWHIADAIEYRRSHR